VWVVSDSETVHRGLSFFDEHQLLVGVWVQPLRSALAEAYVVMAPDDLPTALRAPRGQRTVPSIARADVPAGASGESVRLAEIRGLADSARE
jgi:hypothetical protein